MDYRIRRTATIPIEYKGENILAVIEVGGKVENKNWIYDRFFINGLEQTKKDILKEIKTRGGDEKDFEKMLKEAEIKIKRKLADKKNV